MDRLQNTKIIKMSNMDKLDFDILQLRDKPNDLGVAVYYFPGNGGITSKSASCGCSLVETGISSLIDKHPILEHLSLFGVYYGLSTFDSHYGSMVPDEISSFVQNHLLPRCMDEQGKFLTVLDICKNMSKVTFVGLCHGTTEINNIVCEFQKNLYLSGFSMKAIQQITGCLFQISFAPETKLPLCPQVQIFSLADPHSFGDVSTAFENYEEALGHKIDGILVNYENAGRLFGRELPQEFRFAFFDSIQIFSTKMLNNHKGVDEHSFRNIARARNSWKLKYYADKNLDCVSQMMFFALASGVARGFQTQEKNRLVRVDLNQLYKSIQNIELTKFSPDDLKDHTKGDFSK